MKLGTLYWILTLFSLVIFPGTASAHPHELGNIDHGQSLESYQIKLDFTTDDLIKDRSNLDIILAKKDSIANSIKSDKSTKPQKFDRRKKVEEKKDLKQKEQ